MNYHHLTIEERSCMRKYYVEGLSYRKIAQLIGRCSSVVSKEIGRNCTYMYDINHSQIPHKSPCPEAPQAGRKARQCHHEGPLSPCG